MCSCTTKFVYVEIFNLLHLQSQKLSPTSLWTEYYMLKATLKAKENIYIESFRALISYLKKLNVGCRSKKSNVLTREQILTFLEQGEDEEYLLVKVRDR